VEEKSFAEKLREIRHQTNVIRNTFENTGTISAESLHFLIEKAISHTNISEIANSDWARWRVDVLTKDMEIEELKRQLKDALGN
jgi:hypothetical protein